MSTTTLKDVFSTTVTDCFVNQVATHLSSWLKTNKAVEVSTQELCSAFNVEYTPRPTMAGLPQGANLPTQMPSVPGYYAGTGGPSPARRGGRRKAPVDPNAPKCKYVFQRGNKKGNPCHDPVIGDGQPGGNDYCKACIRKKTVQNRIQGGGSGKSTVKAPSMPNGMVAVPEQPASGGDSNSINALPIPGQPNMFRDVDNGYIIQSCSDGTLIALAMEENGVQRGLTADERKRAQMMGMSLMEEQEVAPVNTAVPTIPTIPTGDPSPPQAAQVAPSVPQVPQVPQAAQVGPSVPQVPQVPQAAPTQVAPSVPQAAPAPQVQSVPQVPTIPQVGPSQPTVTPQVPEAGPSQPAVVVQQVQQPVIPQQTVPQQPVIPQVATGVPQVPQVPTQ